MELARKGNKHSKLLNPPHRRGPGPIGHPRSICRPKFTRKAGLSRLPRTPTHSELQSSLTGSSLPPDNVEMPSIGEENVVLPESEEEVFVSCYAKPTKKPTAGRVKATTCSFLQQVSVRLL